MDSLPDELVRAVLLRVDPRTFYLHVTRACRRWHAIAASLCNGHESNGAIPIRLTLKSLVGGSLRSSLLVQRVKLLPGFLPLPGGGNRVTYVAGEALLAIPGSSFPEPEQHEDKLDVATFLGDEVLRQWARGGLKTGTRALPQRVHAFVDSIQDMDGFWTRQGNFRPIARHICASSNLSKVSVSWPFFEKWNKLGLPPLTSVKSVFLIGPRHAEVGHEASSVLESQDLLSVVPNIESLVLKTLPYTSFLTSFASVRVPPTSLTTITTLRFVDAHYPPSLYVANEIILLNTLPSLLPNLRSIGDITLRSKMWEDHPPLRDPSQTQNILNLWVRYDTQDIMTLDAAEQNAGVSGKDMGHDFITGLAERFPNLSVLRVGFLNLHPPSVARMTSFRAAWGRIVRALHARRIVFSIKRWYAETKVPQEYVELLREVCAANGKGVAFEEDNEDYSPWQLA